MFVESIWNTRYLKKYECINARNTLQQCKKLGLNRTVFYLLFLTVRNFEHFKNNVKLCTFHRYYWLQNKINCNTIISNEQKSCLKSRYEMFTKQYIFIVSIVSKLNFFLSWRFLTIETITFFISIVTEYYAKILIVSIFPSNRYYCDYVDWLRLIHI